ncbi:MAG: trypsin-like peptidase domain-containing protein [Oscillospiraceae bacterium]|nr:trypsin-like peptidase domain-containing protein [Oscillospiraceae bacterium]
MGKKKIIAVICCILIVIAAALPVSASNSLAERAAEKLGALGLMQGTDKGYELDRCPTRAEALAFIVRLSGGEGRQAGPGYETGFTDVPEWAEDYVAWAHEKGIVKGVTETEFVPDRAVSARDFLTMLLRMLGYSDANGDFTYVGSLDFGSVLGLCDPQYSEFDRGDMAVVCLRSMTAMLKGEDARLIDRLSEQEAVNRDVAEEMGYFGDVPLSAGDVYIRNSDAVFFITCYKTYEDYEADKVASTSSGFFISDDGLAVTNMHAISKYEFAVATTVSGHLFEVKSVPAYNVEQDIAVLRVSNVPLKGEGSFVFPYLRIAGMGTYCVGDKVYALGNPLGWKNALSDGIISLAEIDMKDFGAPMILHTASISRGSSGGVLMNEYGDVIGVNSAYFNKANDMYLAVPAGVVLDLDTSGEGHTMKQLVGMGVWRI